jgi:Na+/glutamate symporter
MFAALFASLMEFALFVFAVVVVYQIFLSDWVAARRAQWKEVKGKAASIDKIAQVKLVSGDAKGIEQFVTNNAQYLSDPMVKKLVARIESLQVDQVIADDMLKSRIAELQPEEEEEHAQTIRPQRTSN